MAATLLCVVLLFILVLVLRLLRPPLSGSVTRSSFCALRSLADSSFRGVEGAI